MSLAGGAFTGSPFRAMRYLKAALAADAEFGKQLAQVLLPKGGPGPVNLEGIGAELFRPSNLVPVSKAGHVLKAGGRFGRPLIRELGKEAAFAAAFSGAETARTGGSAEDVALSTGLGAGLGATTPLGLHALGNAWARTIGKNLPDETIVNADGSITRRKRPTRVSNMTPEEQLEAQRPITPEEVLALLEKDTKSDLVRRNQALERIKNPLGMRGTNKSTTNVYADDILTHDGKYYPLRYVQADAGEMVDVPVFSAGMFTLPGKGKKATRRIYLTMNDAEALKSLYENNPNPTVAQVRKTLQDSAGIAPSNDMRVWERPVEGTNQTEQVRLTANGEVETRVLLGEDAAPLEKIQSISDADEEFGGVGRELRGVLGKVANANDGVDKVVTSAKNLNNRELALYEVYLRQGSKLSDLKNPKAWKDAAAAVSKLIDERNAGKGGEVETAWRRTNEKYESPEDFIESMTEQEYVPFEKSLGPRTIDNDYARRVQRHINSLEKGKKPVRRPDTPVGAASKASIQTLQKLNQRIRDLGEPVEGVLDEKTGKYVLPPTAGLGGEINDLETAIRDDRRMIQKGIAANNKAGKAIADAKQRTLAAKEEKLAMLKAERQALVEQRAAELHVNVDEVPGDPVQQEALVRAHFGEVPSTDALPPIPPSIAREMLNRYTSEVEKVVKDKTAVATRYGERIRERNQLAEAIKNGVVPLPRTGTRDTMARAYADYLNKLNFRDSAAKDPSLINRPARAVERLTDYARLADIDAYTDALGRVDIKDRKTARLRAIADKLVNVGNRQDGPAARPFIIDAKGKRVYGSIKMVQPTDGAWDEWVVDFVPDFQPSKGAIPEVRVKDINLEYKRNPDVPKPTGIRKGYDAIARRFEHEREVISRARGEETAPTQFTPEMTMMAQARQEQTASLKAPLIEEADLRTMDDLNKEVDEAWATVQSYGLPTVPNTPDTPTTFARRVGEGYNELMRRPLSKNKDRAAEQLAARSELVKSQRQYVIDNRGPIVDGDPGLQALVDDLGDPVQLDMYMMARQHQPDDLLGRRDNILGSKLQGAMDFMSGYVMHDPDVSSINTQYHWNRGAMADHIITEFDGYTQALRKQALAEHAASGNPRTTRRPDALRFAKGDKELESGLVKGFDPTVRAGQSPEVQTALAKMDDLRPEVKAKLLDKISREIRWAVDFTEDLFPNVSREMKDILEVARIGVKRFNDMAAAQTDRGISRGYLNRMMIDKKLWPLVHDKTLREGSPLEVLVEAARVADNNGWKLDDVLVSGEPLMHAEPLAYWTSIQDVRHKEAIARLATEKLTSDDITHLPGQWSIKSRDKFKSLNADGSVNTHNTKILQESLGHLERSMNRLPDWGGLEGLSRAVSSMVLTLDANIASVQGYAALSSRIMYDLAKLATGIGDRKTVLGGANSFGNYIKSLKNVMSDEGYYNWRRSRAADIQYYAANGLTVGQKAFIAGPSLSKFPLEDVAVIGNLTRGAREFNDLQFNRLLTYLKVTSIDQMLDKANQMRKAGPAASKLMLDLPGIKDVVDEAGGESAFFHGQPEHVVRAAIRNVNNKLGGLDLNAQGIGQYRQIAERILTITPGFLRAQAGQFSTALTRPNSVEGWLATTGVAEEVAFAAAIATGIAAATGNMDKLNYDDMTRADWLAVPFDDSYMPVIPRVGIPRLAARTIAETVDAAQGEGFEGGRAIQSFAQGRMSPLVNATMGPTFFDEDFLGRRYRDKKDRLFAGITSFMPIFIENLATEGRENVAQHGWSSLKSTAYQTPLQFLGKNIVPRPPIEKLDEIASNYSQSKGGPPLKWFELDKLSQDALLQDPDVKAAHDDFTYYQERRQSPKEQQVEQAFLNAEQTVDALRTQPQNINGMQMTMKDAYELLLAGDPRFDGDDYRDRLQITNTRINQAMQDMETRLSELGIDLSADSAEKQKQLRELFKGADSKNILTQLAIWDSQSIQPDSYLEEKTVVTDEGEITFKEVNWDEFFADRESVLAEYDEDIRLSALDAMDKWEDGGIDAYRAASQKRGQIEELPRYRGLSNDEADKVDAMTKSFRDLNAVIRSKIGLPSVLAPLPPGMGKMIRRYALSQMVQQGLITSNDDMRLAATALMMEENPLIREALRAPDQVQALLQNPDVVRFYPYLMRRVPVWARDALPDDLKPRFDYALALRNMQG